MKTWVERDKKMDVMLIFDVVVALFGAYMIFSALQMKKSGKADVIIGTHRIVQKDVEFHALGLAIVDEEQRFVGGI